MKNLNVNKIVIVLACMFLTIGANAQRPVWLLGHGCNSHRCLQNAIIDGANGVEIDVCTEKGYEDRYWTVAHDGFLTRQEMEEKNKSRDELDHYVTLENYLHFSEMNDLCILWLDVKEGSEQFIIDLIKQVHLVLGDNPDISVIYGLYNISILEGNDPGDVNPRIAYIRSMLRPNEGINLAYEGHSSCTFDRVEKLLKDNNFPIEKHLMTWGCCQSSLVTRGSRWQRAIEQAQKLRSQGRYCGRIGFWTSGKAWHSWQFYDTAAFGGYKSDCDLVMAECRNEMAKGFNSKTALKYTWEYYLRESGYYYKKYNNGKCRLATKKDVFFKMP